MTPLLPERAGCPQCGSTDGRRWRSYSGVELCTDCEWDYFSELNGRKLLDAQKLAQEPFKATPAPKRRGGGSILNPGNGLTRRPGGILQTPTRSDRAGVALKGSLSRPRDTNSICRSCGHIFYGATLSHCLRCRGLCEHRSDHDLTLMGRYAQRFIEAER